MIMQLPFRPDDPIDNNDTIFLLKYLNLQSSRYKTNELIDSFFESIFLEDLDALTGFM